MMHTKLKYFLPLLVVAFLMACKTTEVVQYEYRSTTMLGARTLTITKDSVVSQYNGRGGTNRIARTTSPEEWQELKESVKGLKLVTIAGLESPTNRRATDAAPYGSLKLTTKDSTYKSASFDGYDAHADLVPLMSVIKKMAEIK